MVRVIFVRREGRFRKVLGVIWGWWGWLMRVGVSVIARGVLAKRAVVASCRNFLLIAKRGMYGSKGQGCEHGSVLELFFEMDGWMDGWKDQMWWLAYVERFPFILALHFFVILLFRKVVFVQHA